jgi:hypothetical protein
MIKVYIKKGNNIRKQSRNALDSSKHLGYILLPHSYLDGFFLLVKSNS